MFSFSRKSFKTPLLRYIYAACLQRESLHNLFRLQTTDLKSFIENTASLLREDDLEFSNWENIF